MDENNNQNENNSVNTDEILKETTNTFNEAKEQVKNSFKKEELKNSAKETKNFIINMFKNPIDALKNIAEDKSNKAFKYAIILLVIWMIAEVIYRLSFYTLSWNIFLYILPFLKAAVAPILTVLVISISVFVFNKNKDKNLISIISVITAAHLPTVIGTVISLLTIISPDVSMITVPFSSLCYVITSILTYFGIKFIYGENDDRTYIRKFVVIQGIYYIAYVLIALLEIYI